MNSVLTDRKHGNAIHKLNFGSNSLFEFIASNIHLIAYNQLLEMQFEGNISNTNSQTCL